MMTTLAGDGVKCEQTGDGLQRKIIKDRYSREDITILEGGGGGWLSFLVFKWRWNGKKGTENRRGSSRGRTFRVEEGCGESI